MRDEQGEPPVGVLEGAVLAHAPDRERAGSPCTPWRARPARHQRVHVEADAAGQRRDEVEVERLAPDIAGRARRARRARRRTLCAGASSTRCSSSARPVLVADPGDLHRPRAARVVFTSASGSNGSQSAPSFSQTMTWPCRDSHHAPSAAKSMASGAVVIVLALLLVGRIDEPRRLAPERQSARRSGCRPSSGGWRRPAPRSSRAPARPRRILGGCRRASTPTGASAAARRRGSSRTRRASGPPVEWRGRSPSARLEVGDREDLPCLDAGSDTARPRR